MALLPLGEHVAGASSSIVVNDAGDPNSTPADNTQCVPGDEGHCRIRDALAEAASLGGDVTIELPGPDSSQTIYNPGSAYLVDSSNNYLEVPDTGGTVTLDGSSVGQSVNVIQAVCQASCDVSTRVMKIDPGAIASITGVTIEDGSGDNGGGILDCGDLNLSNSTVTTNTAAETGGGIDLSAEGSATLTDDTVSDNTAGGESLDEGDYYESGGGIAVDNSSDSAIENLTVSGSTVNDNTGDNGDGGGIVAFNTDEEEDVVDPNLTVDISNSTITGNELGNSLEDYIYGAGALRRGWCLDGERDHDQRQWSKRHK